ncbi:hypothetical protein V6N13_025374 [Hibiscus sabdariffa]|uniref:Uncharacterized protein n=1 Tax=Hibiscus sabdariffa TaxID=183260 RepID=A0ABR2BKQ0_9ROSI
MKFPNQISFENLANGSTKSAPKTSTGPSKESLASPLPCLKIEMETSKIPTKVKHPNLLHRPGFNDSFTAILLLSNYSLRVVPSPFQNLLSQGSSKPAPKPTNNHLANQGS